MSDDALGLKFVDDAMQLNWTWVVNKKQVLVAWKDGGAQQCLGQLSPHNNKTNLSLWIGHCEDQLLVALHLPISLRASASKKPRDMYMVVPVRALRIGEEGATFSALPSDQLSALLQAQLRTAPLAGCTRLLIYTSTSTKQAML